MQLFKNRPIEKFFIIVWFSIFFFTIYFLIKQPLLFEYKFNNTLLDKTPSVNEENLQNHVKFLSENDRTSKIGQEKIVDFILNQLKINNIDEKNIEIQSYNIKDREYKNIIVHFKEKSKNETNTAKYIIGGHYDSFWELPWADDNASAIAGLLEISRILNDIEILEWKDIDLVFYSTEEPPFFATDNMGSYKHAESVKNDEDIKLVIILEMIGYFSEEENSQDYPISFLKYFYPTKWNFITIVSNIQNSLKTREIKSRFNTFLKINNLIFTESINAPTFIPWIDFSDHRNYWEFNIPALMVTDTAFYRNKNYHTKEDTYQKLDYNKMKEVVNGVIISVLSL